MTQRRIPENNCENALDGMRTYQPHQSPSASASADYRPHLDHVKLQDLKVACTCN